MTEADRKRFSAMMTGLGVAFDLTVTAQRMALYWDTMSDLRIEAVEWGAKEAIRQLKFFPRVKELRDYAAIAPSPTRPAVAVQEMKQIPDLMPVEEQRKRMKRMREELNRKYGTSFAIDDSQGRPTLVSGGGQ